MPRSPFEPTRGSITDPDLVALWATYEADNARAADRYWGFHHRSRCNCGRFARWMCAVCKAKGAS